MAAEKLGPYRLERVLGKGGMGIVYAGVDERTGTRAAVKVLLGNLDDRPNLRVRFEAEIESLKRLRHANIVQLYAYGEEDGQLFYSMELVDGRSLQDELKAGRIFSVPETLRIGLQIAIGLKLAHDSGIIHRDIKPANLLITREGVVKLTDFGIAKLFGGSQVTADGGVVGTVDYMSPEQAEGKPVTHRSDLYAVGGVLYALLARVPPFGGRSVPQIIHALRFDAPPALRLRAPHTPTDVEELILKLLAKEPKDRVPTALVLAKRLHELAKRYPLPGRPAAAAPPPSVPGSPALPPSSANSPAPFPTPPTHGEPPITPPSTPTPPTSNPPSSIAPATRPSGVEPPGAGGLDRNAARDSEGSTDADQGQKLAELTADERYAAAEIKELLSTVELTWESQINQLVPASEPRTPPTDDVQPSPPESLDDDPLGLGNPLGLEEPLGFEPLSDEHRHADSRDADPLMDDPLTADPLAADPLAADPLDHGSPAGPVTSANAVRTAADAALSDPLKPGQARHATSVQNAGGQRGALPPTLDSRSSRQPPPLLPPSVVPPSGMADGTGASGQGDARLSASSSRFTTVAEDEQRRQLEQQREELQERSHFLLKTIVAVVVVVLLAVGAVLLSLPPSADSLYDDLRLAASRDDDEALAAVEPQLKLFLESHPGDARASEVAGWKAKLDLAAEQRRFDRRFRRWDSAAAMGPVERLYGEAMQEAATDPDRARERLQALVDAYAAHPPEEPAAQRSLKLAVGQLERLDQLVKRQHMEELKLAREQMRWADEQLDKAPEKSAAVYRGLAALYADKPWAKSLIDELKSRLATPTAKPPSR